MKLRGGNNGPGVLSGVLAQSPMLDRVTALSAQRGQAYDAAVARCGGDIVIFADGDHAVLGAQDISLAHDKLLSGTTSE
jgi:hypothetical protein